MRRFAFLAAAAAAPALLAAAPAAAQVAPAPTFTGLRVEGLAGFDRSQASGTHDDGVLYGAALGYDMQMRGFVVGVEGELNDSTVKDCYGASTLADPRVCASAKRDIYVGGRVGEVVGQRALLYVKAGYTNGRYRLGYDDGVDAYGYSKNLDGIRLGAGAEYAVGPNSYVKAEYRYSNYQDDVSRHQIVGGFGFRF